MFPQTRPRRNRRFAWLRRLVSEVNLNKHDLILPLLVTRHATEEFPTMPSVYKYSIEDCVSVVGKAIDAGISAVSITPIVPKELTSQNLEESYNPDNLLCSCVREIKARHGNRIGVIANLSLGQYSTHGHDGVLSADGVILNDKTVEISCKQALVHAAAGADAVSPSNMMDGNVMTVRQALDNSGFNNTGIFSYAVQYHSNSYQPFRSAVNPELEKGVDKSTYQIDFHNAREAELETYIDIAESADMIIVQPSLMYLDIIYRVKQISEIPIIGRQSSGEFLMIRSMPNWLECMYESLVCSKRAGCDAIITYAALEIASII